MRKLPIYISAAAMLVVALFATAASTADQHTSEALEHATEAVKSGKDSKAVAEHAAEALKHIEAAKAAQASHPEVLKQINKGEAYLQDALKNATRFNTDTAVQDATDAKLHLNAADTAAKRLEAGKTQPETPNK